MAELINRVKRLMRAALTNRQQKRYFRLLEQKKTCYDEWIKAAEEEMKRGGRKGEAFIIKNISYEACKDYMTGSSLREERADIIIFSDSCGESSSLAEKLITDCFADHASMDIAYGDEDVISPDGTRHTPWLKPGWSPDTFLAYFYFGNIFAVRTQALKRLNKEQTDWIWQEEQAGIWRMCYLLAVNSEGFGKRTQEDIFSFPIGHIDEIIYHSHYNREMEIGRMSPDRSGFCKGSGAGNKNGRISIIIPSRDHPDILKRCIRSIQQNAGCMDYEIIVVDNGSTGEVRLKLAGWLAENGARYIYEEQPFNFSRMCNLGAGAAAGNVLLFLNDDVEVISREDAETGFLQRMYEAALNPYTGAVGAKLYYPDSNRIQHAGIVNQELGPVHKLQFKEDDVSFYYGFNRRQRNVIAVTGACLAVERDKFTEAGGFPEELPVAFNDVDLCFSLFEKGYYNVVLQEVTLYHHESLSRGNDEDKEKLIRLLGEREKLYERHPAMHAKDPFYHKYFATGILSTGFELQADYVSGYKGAQYKKEFDIITQKNGILAHAREDACVIISLEYAGNERGAYLISGYSFVTGSDNACYEKSILLRRGGSLFVIRPEALPRRDVEDNLPHQIHVGLTGFRAYIRERDLQAGTYRIGILAKDQCNGAKIYSWTNRYLTVNT